MAEKVFGGKIDLPTAAAIRRIVREEIERAESLRTPLENMKLYAFTPKGHGQESFFVIAENEDEAKHAINKKIEEVLEKGEDEQGVPYREYDFQGWGTEYYRLTIYEIGQVALHNND